MLSTHKITLPVVYITAINRTKQTILVTYQLELLHVDFWKHSSFPAHLRPNWCQNHTSERNSPPPLYASLYERYI